MKRSTRSRTGWGIFSPSRFAVLRLVTRLDLVRELHADLHAACTNKDVAPSEAAQAVLASPRAIRDPSCSPASVRRMRCLAPAPDPFEQRPNCRPIRRALPDMTHSNPSHWIHENVAAELVDVAGGTSWPMTSRDQLGILQPGRGPPNRRPSTMTHPIGAVESTLPVHQQGPLEIRLAHVLLGTLPSLERYDDNA